MARVSLRVGVARSSVPALLVGGFQGALAWFTWQLPVLPWLFLGTCAFAVFLAFVHPDRVVALDTDDDASVKVGDRADG